MKIPNKKELEQIAFNYSSDIDFHNFMDLYENVLQNHIRFLVVDTIFASDNSSRFRKNLLKII